MTEMGLQVEEVYKAFGEKVVLNGISFVAQKGEFIVLVGPSGCGKSTMLRAIAGLESVGQGKIIIGERDVTELDPKDRNIAMVFQDYALYPHKSVYENIAFGLRVRKLDPERIDRLVREAAEKLSLTELLDRKPLALSGGQRQRVAIGRAIVRKPDVFLFDEPLSNLDAKLRGSMRLEISKLHQDLGATIVYVTHDQVEAMTLADKIIVLDSGRIQQMGSPLDLYYHPSNTFVATFIGSPPMNLIAGELKSIEGHLSFCSQGGLKFRLPKNHLPAIEAGMKGSSQKVMWGLRPENLRFDAEENAGDLSFESKVLLVEPHGATTLVVCEVYGHEIQVTLPEPHRPHRGDRLPLKFVSKHIYLFDAESGEALAPS